MLRSCSLSAAWGVFACGNLNEKRVRRMLLAGGICVGRQQTWHVPEPLWVGI
jgi:hypothetical protein